MNLSKENITLFSKVAGIPINDNHESTLTSLMREDDIVILIEHQLEKTDPKEEPEKKMFSSHIPMLPVTYMTISLYPNEERVRGKNIMLRNPHIFFLPEGSGAKNSPVYPQEAVLMDEELEIVIFTLDGRVLMQNDENDILDKK